LRSCGSLSIPFPAPQDGAYPQEEFVKMKGLGEIIVAAGLEA
jgi:hypothetical protein